MKWNPNRIAQSLGGLILLIAASALTGHAAHVEELASWSGVGRVTMKVETAWLLIFLATALAEVSRGRPSFARGQLPFALLLCTYVAGVYLSAWPGLCSGVDCTLSRAHPASGTASPLTVVMGLIDCAAIYATTRAKYRIARWLEGASVVLALMVYALHAIGIDVFYDLTGANGMALPTVTAFSLLTAGTFLVALEHHFDEVQELRASAARLRQLRDEAERELGRVRR